MKKRKKKAPELDEAVAILTDQCARSFSEIQSRLEHGFKNGSRELADDVKAILERLDVASTALADAVAAVQLDVKHWRHDFATLEARIERIEKKLALSPRQRVSR